MINERIFEIISGNRSPPCKYYSPGYLAEHANLRGFFCSNLNTKSKPRISYGVAIRDLNMDKWCCVSPASTIEFRILLEGNYIPAELPIIISQLYDNELRIVKENITKDIFRAICKKFLLRELTDLFYAIYVSHMESIRMIATNVIEERKMQTVFADVCQLGFPKGRGIFEETPLDSAIRELKEETGVKLNLKREGSDSEWFWERVTVEINDVSYDGVLFQEPVAHTHIDISGKAFRTLIWVVHIRLPKDVTDLEISVGSSTTPHEIGSIGWHSTIYCSRFSRVKDLFRKVWLMSEDIKSIVTME